MAWKDYKEDIVHETPNWKIIRCEYRGAEIPFYKLYKKKAFLFINYWSYESWSIELTTIEKYIERWDNWE